MIYHYIKYQFGVAYHEDMHVSDTYPGTQVNQMVILVQETVLQL